MAKNLYYQLRLSKEDRMLFQGAANLAGMPLAEWLRQAGRMEAKRAAEQQGGEQNHVRH